MRPIATIVLALAAAVALTACSAGPAHPLRTLEPSSVTRAEIRDGTTGELRTITDEDGLHRLTELLGGLAMTRSEDQGARVGYVFSVTLYAGDEVVEQALINPATAVVERVYYDLDTDPTPALRDLFEAAAGGPTAGTPLRGDAPVGTTTDAGEPSDLVERAIDDLAQRLGVGRQEIAVERFEPRELPTRASARPSPTPSTRRRRRRAMSSSCSSAATSGPTTPPRGGRCWCQVQVPMPRPCWSRPLAALPTPRSLRRWPSPTWQNGWASRRT